MEVDEITIEAADHVFNILRGHGVVWFIVGQALRGGSKDGVPERIERKVSTNVVGGGIDADLVFEPSGIDLKIVVCIAPPTEPGGGVV